MAGPDETRDASVGPAVVDRALAEARRFLGRPGVAAVAYGYKVTGGVRTSTKSVVVGVWKKVPRALLRDDEVIPTTVLGIPTDVVEVGEIKATAMEIAPDPTARVRPCPGGVSVGHPDITAGTLGSWVRKHGDSRQWFMLSNNHVLANEGRSRIGDPILQPGPADGGSVVADRVASLADVAPLGDPVLVDAAVAQADRPEVVDPSVGGIGPVLGWREVELGESVTKSGRTTGVTVGEVVGVDAVVDVMFSTGVRRCVDQLLIGPGGFSAPGDSGSVIVSTQDQQAVGLLFAGSPEITVANRMSNVVRTLGIRFGDDEEGETPIPEPPVPPPQPPDQGSSKTSWLCRWWAAFRVANRRLARRARRRRRVAP